MTSWILPILAIGFMIIVHEAGHFVVARLCGMHVEQFSIGFGPAIPGLSWRSKKGTKFQLAPIPFGGFVNIRGMNILEEVDPDDHSSYANRPAWQRFATIFAGPATNYVSAVILAFAVFTCHGVQSREGFYEVASIVDGFDAKGKMQPGDVIVAVDGVPLFANGAGPTLTERVLAKKGEAMSLRVRRGADLVDVSVTPRAGDPEKKQAAFILGITYQMHFETVDVGVPRAAKHALIYPVVTTQAIVTGLYRIITGKEKAVTRGPKGIVEDFKTAFDISLVSGLKLLMLLSVYIGLFNLLPVPALDGGRLVFLIYELVTRRRANPKIEGTVHMVGVMVLLVVMVLVTLRDCSVI